MLENLSIDQKRLVQDLKLLGIEKGDNLIMRVSLKEMGYIDGGVETFIESILETIGPDGGIFGLSFTKLYNLPLNNKNSQQIYTLKTPSPTGIVNNFLLNHPKAVRSRHPSRSFVGIGPKAEELLPKHTANRPAFEPILKLSEFSNSKTLLIGTITKSPGVMSVHVAQNLLKFKNSTTGKKGVFYLDDNNEVKLYVKDYVGGCSMGFDKFYEYYRKAGAVREGKIGNADSMLAQLDKTLKIDLEILRENPDFFFCNNPLCLSCRTTWEFNEKTFRYYILKYLFPLAIKINRFGTFNKLKRFIKV